ncbi:MAG: hypothetical protein KatS3mg108_2907 [Isosphaeraceae bacterium]|jgi:predicted neuraminidase|nr:MAG: hypothetical protein KatS3mg108_2907 [Isosphaeraceae bacterium]
MLSVALVLAVLTVGEEPEFATEAIFTPEALHNHASCVVELADGSLLVAWYRGSGERQADDVVIMGSRKRDRGTAWEQPFVMADTPGYPDCNPVLFAAPDGAVWMWWPTILDHRWEGALLKYLRASRPGTEGPPPWDSGGVFHVTPQRFAEAMEVALAGLNGAVLKIAETYFEEIRTRSKDELYQRLGWMPRVHPLVLPGGRWLLPLYSDTFSCSLIAISDDAGRTWSFSTPLIGFGNIQPSLVRREDGTIVALMRENGPRLRIRQSTSTDQGQSWGPVEETALPNPGAGIEAIRLTSGRWCLAYNDTVRGRHSLALALSDDEGRTWTRRRHVERSQPGEDAFHYPSLIQGRDGTIHLTYTRRTEAGSTIQYAAFTEAWIEAGDPATGEP